MDLVTIARKDYQPNQLVELDWKTDTLIWTERFQPVGDFELHTQNIDGVAKLLPERSMCSLLDTNEVMWVDSHDITTSDGEDDSIDELVIKGRTLDWILMRRIWANAPYGKKTSMQKKYSVRQALEVWVWNAICNGTGNDRIKASQSYNSNNQIPNVVVTDSIPASTDGPNKARKIQNGYVYDQMQTFLSSGDYGIRIIRPGPNGSKGRVVSVAADGTFSTASSSSIDELRFDFFKGRDISDKIAFAYDAGHFSSAEYLQSSENLMTGVFVDGDAATDYYTDPDILPGTNAGWNRLDGYVDGGSKDDGESTDDFQESLEDLGLKTVRREGKHIDSVEAEISPNINYIYNKDYRLGDRVMVQGQYGIHNKRYITEVIRSQDINGETIVPTLSTSLSDN